MSYFGKYLKIPRKLNVSKRKRKKYNMLFLLNKNCTREQTDIIRCLCLKIEKICRYLKIYSHN